VEAFIASVKRIRALTEDATRPVELHLTTHAFSTRLTEAKELLKTRQRGDPHPLVDLPGFRRQLDELPDNLASPGEASQIASCQRVSRSEAIYDLLKLLNDCSAGDLAELDNNELQRFETLCENWRTLVEAERARRKSLPRPTAGTRANT